MKTFITNFAVSIILMVNLSGCMDFEFPDMSGLSGLGGFDSSYDWPNPYDYDYHTASFYVDSVVQMSDSKVKIWAQIRYDSVLTIENRNVVYWDLNGIEVNRVIQSKADTINFRELPDSTLNWLGRYEWIYKYTVEVDSLKKDFDYAMYISNNYTEKGQLKSFLNWLSVRLK